MEVLMKGQIGKMIMWIEIVIEALGPMMMTMLMLAVPLTGPLGDRR